MSPINFFILLGTVFASFAALPAFSQSNVTVINNNGKMIVNWQIFGFDGQGDPTKDTYFIRTCGDVETLTKTKDLYYTVKMGIFTDYILPKGILGDFYKDPCMILAGNAASSSENGGSQPFMYSPYDPNDVDKFKIEDVVVDVKYTSNLYGSSQEGITKDGRKSISAWGSQSDYSDVGGCCKATNDPKEIEGWYKPYTLYATPLNMSYVYFHSPTLTGVWPYRTIIWPYFTIQSKVTDIYMKYDPSLIDFSCTWEIKNVATGASVDPITDGDCILYTDVTAVKEADTNYSVSVSVKPLPGKGNKVLWKTKSTTATEYIIVPKSGIPTASTTTATTTTATTTTASTTAASTTTASTTTVTTTAASTTAATTTTATTTTASTTNTVTTTAAPTRPTTPTPSGSLATTSATVKKESKNNGTTLIIVGCVIAAIVIIGLIFISLFLYRRVKKARKIAGFEP